jgi:SAM-dependent methyltransferase
LNSSACSGRVHSLAHATAPVSAPALGLVVTAAAASPQPESYVPPVSFTVAADAYDRFMGRYSAPLAPRFADFAAIAADQRVLDVGCGPGALTAELVTRLGAAAVSAVDPSEPFVAAAQARYPGVEVRRAAAEQLPFVDQVFDVALAQLVVHFMADPVAGLREMARVTQAHGVVAACVWDHAGGQGPLSVFWEAAHQLDPDVEDESQLAGARKGHLAQLFEAAGLREIEESALAVTVDHPSFEEWWEPFTLGVGPAGSYAARLDANRQDQLRELCRELLPAAPFELTVVAWAARGLV